MTPNSPPTRLPLWQKKQPITAQRLSGIVDAINRGASGAAPPSQVFANINTPQISYAKIVAVHGSYLAVTDAGGAAFYVAKPPRLRSDDTSARAVAGQTYTVTKSAFTTGIASGDAQTCTATRSSDSGTDTLEVVEPYLVNDEIMAFFYDTGVADGNGNPVMWQDLNVDARHWAVKSTA